MKDQAFNPYLPSYEYIPDGEPYVFDGRVYIFGSHDKWDGKSFCINDYVTWSADVDDLANWRYEGVIYRRDQDPFSPDGRYPMFAPDMQKGTDGKYYLYYSSAGAGCVSVAVCDSPCGKFEFHGHVQREDGTLLGRQDGDPMPFDPGAFVDDDGSRYLYAGFVPWVPPGAPRRKMDYALQTGPFAVKLKEDMFTMDGEPMPIDIIGCPCFEHSFFEASSMRKIDGRYYFVYSTQSSHELCYAMGDSPVGPFTYGGVIHSNGNIGLDGRKPEDRVSYSGNNHGSLVKIKDRWYIFGHRMTNYTCFSRQGVAEPITILPDGSIPQVEMTSCGLNGGPLRGVGTYEARIACEIRSKNGALHYNNDGLGELGDLLRREHPVFRQDGEDRLSDPNQHIANIHDGALACYKYFNLGEAKTVSVKTRGGAGTMYVRTAPNGENCAAIPLTAGEEWRSSEKVSLTTPQGTLPLYFIYSGEAVVDFIEFTLE